MKIGTIMVFRPPFFGMPLPPTPALVLIHLDLNIFYGSHGCSDIKRRTFYHEERLNRDGWDAFCSTQKMKMRNGNWSLEQYENERMELEATIQEEIVSR